MNSWDWKHSLYFPCVAPNSWVIFNHFSSSRANTAPPSSQFIFTERLFAFRVETERGQRSEERLAKQICSLANSRSRHYKAPSITQKRNVRLHAEEPAGLWGPHGSIMELVVHGPTERENSWIFMQRCNFWARFPSKCSTDVNWYASELEKNNWWSGWGDMSLSYLGGSAVIGGLILSLFTPNDRLFS